MPFWVLDEVGAWIPSNRRLNELGQSPKHQLADPALAAQLLGIQAETLLAGKSAGPRIPRDGTLLGALFESLATLSVRVYTTQAEAKLGHLRTARGRQEIDLIVERADGRVVAIEVKLSRAVDDDDTKHLAWLEQRLGAGVLDRLIITTGPQAYRLETGSPWCLSRSSGLDRLGAAGGASGWFVRGHVLPSPDTHRADRYGRARPAGDRMRRCRHAEGVVS